MTVTTSKWKVYSEMPAAGGWWDQRADGCGYGHNLAYHTTVSWIRPSPVFFLGVVGWVTWLGPTHRMVWWCLVSCCFFWGRCVDNFCKYSNFLSFGWDYRDCKSPRLAFLRSHDCSWKFHITSWWFPRGYVKYQTYSISIWSSVITHRVNWTLQFFPSHQMVL